VNGVLESFSSRNAELIKIAESKITALAEDDRGKIWIGTFSNGLCRLSPEEGTIENVQLPSRLTGSGSVSALFYSKDKLYIGTLNGLYILDLKTKEIQKYLHDPANQFSVSGNHITSIYSDNGARVWVGTENNGLNLFDYKTKKFIRFRNDPSNPKSIADNTIYSIYKDRSDNLWIGTANSGLNKLILHPGKFRSVSRESRVKGGLKNFSVRSVYVDETKCIWLGTDNGLYIVDSTGNRIRSFFYNPADKYSLNDNKVWAISRDRNGDLWIGTQRGLAKYNKIRNNFERFVFPEGNSPEPPVFAIRTIYADENNDLWLGTFGAGLFRFSQSQKKFTSLLDSIKNPSAVRDIVIFQIYEDRKKNLWLVTPSGLACFDPVTKAYSRFFTESSSDFPSQYRPLYNLYDGGNDQCWLGTLRDGLILCNLKDKRYHRYNEHDGLANNVIYAILPDNKGNLWLSTNNGISRFTFSDASFKNFSVDDGIPGREFNTGAYFMDKENNLYFGGTEGLVYFNPDLITENTRIPQIAISNFKVFDLPVSKNKVIFNGDTIKLAYHDNFFSIEFTALDFTAPLKNQYAYKLEGYDKNWISSGKRRYAAYTNLNPGNYTFKVRAANNDGYWNNNGISVAVIIEPPYYMTWWFRMIIGSLIAAMMAYGYRKRVAVLKSETAAEQKFAKQLIESQEAERFRIASELHDGLGQNLLTIINRSKMALKKSINHTPEQQLIAISETAQESIEEVRRISRNLHPYQISSIGLTKTIHATINNLSEASGLNTVIEIDNLDNLFSPEYEINIFRIIQEGFNNIIKHSKATEARLIIRKLPGSVSVQIEDNGIGMKPDQLQAVLSTSKGLGLLSIRQRLSYLEGVLSINSMENKGLFLSFNIPIKIANEKNL